MGISFTIYLYRWTRSAGRIALPEGCSSSYCLTFPSLLSLSLLNQLADLYDEISPSLAISLVSAAPFLVKMAELCSAAVTITEWPGDLKQKTDVSINFCQDVIILGVGKQMVGRVRTRCMNFKIRNHNYKEILRSQWENGWRSIGENPSLTACDFDFTWITGILFLLMVLKARTVGVEQKVSSWVLFKK